MSDQTEFGKLCASTGTLRTIHEFMDWIMHNRGVELSTYTDRWKRIDLDTVDRLAEEFIGIDQDKLAEEELELEAAAGRLP